MYYACAAEFLVQRVGRVRGDMLAGAIGGALAAFAVAELYRQGKRRDRLITSISETGHLTVRQLFKCLIALD